MFAALLLTALPLVAPQSDEGGQATVYRLDRIETLAGEAIENGSIIVRDGIIERMGQSVIAPDNAKVIDLRGSGAVAMPPLALGQAGFLPTEPRGRGANGRYTAAASYSFDEDAFNDLREHGVLLVHLDPPGTGIPGRTSLVRSDAEDVFQDALVRDLHLKLTLDMNKQSKDLLRKALKDADAAMEKEEKARADWKKARSEWEEKQKAKAEAEKKAKEEGKGKEGGKAADEPKKEEKEPPKEFEAPRIDPNLKPIIEWVRQERVAQVWLSTPGELLHWLDIVDERELAWEIVLQHGSTTNFHEVADAIADTGVRVSLPARITYLPSTRLRNNLPAILAQAGVEKMVLLPTTSGSLNSMKSWRVALADIVREGMDRTAALRAISVEPAMAVGQEELVAPLEAGGPASFVIFDGDPLDPLAQVTHLVSAGEVIYDREKEEEE